MFEACLRPLVYSRHHWLLHKGEYRVRADLRASFEALRLRDPLAWDDEEADLMLCLFALDTASTGLDDLVERVDSAAVRDVLHARHALYAGLVAPGEQPPATLLALARRVERLRPSSRRRTSSSR